MKTRRYFTEAARQAAAKARREKSAERLANAERSKLVVFVLRADALSNRFRWEIRRFGALEPVRESAGCYATPQDAMAEGSDALSALHAVAERHDPTVGHRAFADAGVTASG